MASNIYVAYCGGKMSCDNTNPYVTPRKSNIQNILDNWSSATGTSPNRPKNETDADAFVFEKITDDRTGDVISVDLHVFKTCCSPKMICTYNGAGKIINDNTNIWQKILDKGTENEIRVMADYNKFTDANIRIGSYGNGETYEGFASPSTVEYSFINGNGDGNDIPEATNPSMFENVETLVSCDIPCQMRFISDKTFYNCRNLTSYSSPDWIDTIGVSAFEGCTSMINLVIGKNAKLSTRSFAECTNATTIEWSNRKETDGKCRITDIADAAFRGCTSLRYTKFSDSSAKDAIIIPKGISGISEYAFSGCSSIHNLKMYDVTTIGGHAFQGCTNLQGISGMSNVTSVGEYAFDLNGSDWQTDSMGDLSQITSIGEGAFSYVKFNGSINLSSSSDLSVGNKAFYYANVNGDVTVPSNLSTIPYQCFYGLNPTGNVYIYSDTVGEEAFAHATFGNKDLDLAYVDKIACKAFYESNVESVTFKNGVVLGDSSCESGSFESCNNLSTVTFNGSATIGKRSFYSCGRLQNIIIEGSEVEVSRDSDSFNVSGPVVHLKGYTKGSTAPADYPSWVQYYEVHNWQGFDIKDSEGNILYAAGRGQ